MSSTAMQRVDGAGTPAHAAQALASTEFSGEQIRLIRDTVAKGATEAEFALFMYLSQQYGLDPLAKEIWCIKYGSGPATIYTSRDGYLKIANGHPAFDGIQGDVVRANDRFQTAAGGVEHVYAQGDRGTITGAYALVYRRDRRHPAYVFAPFDEYNSPKNGTWKTYPSAMILKVAEAMALKRAFSISGLVTREEMMQAEPATIEDADVVDSRPVQTRIERPTRPADPRERVRQADFPGKALVEGPPAKPATTPERISDPQFDKREMLRELTAALDAAADLHRSGTDPEDIAAPVGRLLSDNGPGRDWPETAVEFARAALRHVMRGASAREAINAAVAEAQPA